MTDLPQWLIHLLELTSLHMKQPPMFGGFHICAAVLSILIPILLIRRFPSEDPQRVQRRLCILGWILILLEIYKQLFLYVIVNNMHYCYWYFPFQLCSMGMYLCALLPLFRGRLKSAVLTFLFDFSLPGALLALLFPEDFLRDTWALTLHGFIYHSALVYVALSVYRAGMIDTSARGYLEAAGLYLVLALCAVGLNLYLRPFVTDGIMPNLFYLAPNIKTGQLFFRQIAEMFGTRAEHIIYVFLYLLLCGAFHYAARIVPAGRSFLFRQR